MKRLLQLPLLAKVGLWLCLHVLVFGLCFLLFINWQMGMGLDSLLSGSAGKRLKAFGDEVVETLLDTDLEEWDSKLGEMAAAHKLDGFLVFSQNDLVEHEVPEAVIERISGVLPPAPPPGAGQGRGPGMGPGMGPAGQRGPGGPPAAPSNSSENDDPYGPNGPYGPTTDAGTESRPAPPHGPGFGGPQGQRPYPPPHMRQGPGGQGGPGFGGPGGQRPYPPPHMRQGQGGQYPQGPGGPGGQGPGGQSFGGPGGQGSGGQGPSAGTNQGSSRFRAHPATIQRPEMQTMGGQARNSAMAANMFAPDTSAEFLMRCDEGKGYWAGVVIHFPPIANMPRHPTMLLLRSDKLDGDGMFFDFKPWLWGALAVLVFSLLFWTPFVWNISRYLKNLTAAAGDIAGGRFQVSLPPRPRDELGALGESIESMSKRLDHMVSGQKRFLADAAHELCGPLARVRTGLGILEARMEGADAASLQSIEADVEELAGLVDEVLSFSRAGRQKAVRKRVLLHDVVDDAIRREGSPCRVDNEVADDLMLVTDPALVSRAVGNLIRNAAIHVGPDVKVRVQASDKGGMIELSVEDDGPGVPADELEQLFEPFYRLDESRSRDSGGSGLGLAIVRTSIETCSGEVKAFEAPGGGFGVLMRLPKSPPGSSKDVD